MEEVQKDRCSDILRGTLRTPSRPSSIMTERSFQRNNKLVWDETIRIMNELFDNVWGDRSEVVVDHCMEITLPVRTLCDLHFTHFPSHNISTRLPSSSSASQVVYAVPNGLVS